MDRERFDALARLLATQRSRRGALGAILGVALLGHGPDDSLAKPGKGKKGKKRGKIKGGNQNSSGSAQLAQAEAKVCCGPLSCTKPTKGSNKQKCNYAGQDLSGINAAGSNLQQINGQGTTFSTAAKPSNYFGSNFGRNGYTACLQRSTWVGANLKGTNFDQACLFDADFTGAIIDNSANMQSARFCRTKMPDGTINNRDCNKGNACCSARDTKNPCPGGKLCCNGKCVDGNCCGTDTSTCDQDRVCVKVTCENSNCKYTPVNNGPGPNCDETCCKGICCEEDAICHEGKCCVPNCYGKKCGPDGCGRTCGTCPPYSTCSGDGKSCNCDSGYKPCGGKCIPKDSCCPNGKPDKCPDGQKCCGGACIPSSKCCTDGVADKCPYGKQCCKGDCIPENQCCPACPQGETCLGGRCCPDARVCGNKCLDRPCDSSECLRCNTQSGICEFKCAGDKKCCGGECIDKDACCTNDNPGCPDDETCCGGACVKKNSPCGDKCDNICDDGKTCCGGRCIKECVTAPTPEKEPFPGGPPPPGCIRLSDDPEDEPLPVGGCEVIEGSCGCKIKVCTTKEENEPKVFSFHPVAGQPTCTIAEISVKGGTDQNEYTFNPPALCSDGLIAPERRGISHVDICDISCC